MGSKLQPGKSSQDLCGSAGSLGLGMIGSCALEYGYRRSTLNLIERNVRLAGKEAIAINRAGSHYANLRTAFVDDQVPIVCHSDSLIAKSEANNLPGPLLFLLKERGSADEPWLIRLDVGREACISYSEIHLAGHFLAIERQSGLGS